MFNDEELREEIHAMFYEQQEAYRDRVLEDLLTDGEVGSDGSARGRTGKRYDKGAARGRTRVKSFRVFHPSPPKSDARKAALRRYEHKHTLDDIKERLLAGERPKLGGRGRPPTRWFKAAEELGIDLRSPAPAPAPTPTAA